MHNGSGLEVNERVGLLTATQAFGRSVVLRVQILHTVISGVLIGINKQIPPVQRTIHRSTNHWKVRSFQNSEYECGVNTTFDYECVHWMVVHNDNHFPFRCYSPAYTMHNSYPPHTLKTEDDCNSVLPMDGYEAAVQRVSTLNRPLLH